MKIKCDRRRKSIWGGKFLAGRRFYCHEGGPTRIVALADHRGRIQKDRGRSHWHKVTRRVKTYIATGEGLLKMQWEVCVPTAKMGAEAPILRRSPAKSKGEPKWPQNAGGEEAICYCPEIL